MFKQVILSAALLLGFAAASEAQTFGVVISPTPVYYQPYYYNHYYIQRPYVVRQYSTPLYHYAPAPYYYVPQYRTFGGRRFGVYIQR